MGSERICLPNQFPAFPAISRRLGFELGIELGIRARNSSSDSKFYYSLGLVYEFVCVSLSTGNLNCMF
jgi:hypothetical protein